MHLIVLGALSRINLRGRGKRNHTVHNERRVFYVGCAKESKLSLVDVNYFLATCKYPKLIATPINQGLDIWNFSYIGNDPAPMKRHWITLQHYTYCNSHKSRA